MPDRITDPKRRENVEAVRNEISERAAGGDTDAIRVLNEIQEKEVQLTSGKPMTRVEGEATPMGVPAGGEVELHTAIPEVTVKVEKEDPGHAYPCRRFQKMARCYPFGETLED